MNNFDCGIFMIHNADCLASGVDPLSEPVNGVVLRIRYLKRLMELEAQGKPERQIIETVLPPDNILRIKRRRLSPDVSEDESSEDQSKSKKLHAVQWSPPSRLGNKVAWIEEREKLAAATLKCDPQQTSSRCQERAEELLEMIEAIGCKEVMDAWEKAVTQWKRQAKPEKRSGGSTAETIYLLAERTEVRTLKDKAVLRVAKWIFAVKILQDVTKLRQQGPPSRQYNTVNNAGRGGNAVSRALIAFMEEVGPKVSPSNLVRNQKPDYSKYKKWWDDGQVCVALSSKMGAGILLLIPGSCCATDGHRISTTQ